MVAEEALEQAPLQALRHTAECEQARRRPRPRRNTHRARARVEALPAGIGRRFTAPYERGDSGVLNRVCERRSEGQHR